MNISSVSISGTAVPLAPQESAPTPQSAAVSSLQTQSAEPTVAMPVAAPAQAVVEQAVEKVKQHIEMTNSTLDFSIDEDSGKTIVRITDRATGDLIRQVPSEEMLQIARSLDQMQGILVQEKA